MDTYQVLSLIKKLYPFHYRVNGIGNDLAIPKYLEELNFAVYEYPEGAILNGWPVPRSELVTKAEIKKNGELVYDGLSSPLGVILSTAPFKGKVKLSELKKHLHYHTENNNAIPFHCTQQYRAGQNEWGFCMPKNLYDKLVPGQYDVEIAVKHAPTTMKCLEYVIPGETENSVVIQSHNCHPFQANDDMSGCAVGIRFMQELKKIGRQKFTYRLLISPELTGTLFWLHKTVKKPETIKGAIILPAVGNKSNLRLQNSFSGESNLDKFAEEVLERQYGSFESGAFRSIYGNDETVFEAPGFSIPAISLTRYPFPTYHSNFDLPDQLSIECLNETVDVLLDITKKIESFGFEKNKNTNHPRVEYSEPKFVGYGLYCLSHPEYDLYRRVWDPSDKHGPKDRDEDRNWNMLMNVLPRRLDGFTTLSVLAEEFNLPLNEVERYCQQWIKKGLVRLPVKQ